MVDTIKSLSITNIDAVPFQVMGPGQGGIGRPVTVADWCAATATGLQATGSTYRLARIPSHAVLQSVVIATDKAPDAASAKTVAFDLNVAFSDSVQDGTPVFLQGLIPTSANTGGTTTVAAYSSPNKMFGTLIETSNTVAYGPTDIVFNGIGTTYNFSGLVQQPLWQTFGFTNAIGSPADPGGYFDLLALVITAATTGQACNIYTRITYTI